MQPSTEIVGLMAARKVSEGCLIERCFVKLELCARHHCSRTPTKGHMGLMLFDTTEVWGGFSVRRGSLVSEPLISALLYIDLLNHL